MAVSHIETGKRQMSANMARKFSEFFGCSTDYLLCTDGADNTDTITCEAAKIVALAGKIISRPALTELFTVAQGVDDDMLEAVTAMLRTYIQRKDLKEHYKEERKND